MVRRLAAVAVLLSALAANASAQIVRGTVIEENNNAPLQGVFIVLVDSAGNTRGGTLSDANGLFAMRAPFEGRFALRAERIGHQSTTTRYFSLTAAQGHTEDIRVAVAAIALAPIDVKGAKRCEVRRDQGARTAQLWEEARKALTVAGWVEKEQIIRFESRKWERELDPYSLAVRQESVKYDISGSRPFRAVSADSLARYGFVQNWGDDVVYFGPDADVLLSDVFLEKHCFRSVVGDGDNTGMVGLVFEPMRSQTQRDIEGTLWLDAKTLELRYIEFRYTNLPRTYQVKTIGGRTDFRRLSSGAWVVDRWYIRMPMTAVSAARDNLYLIALREEGGEIVAIRDRNKTTRVVADGSIRGAVYDSMSRRPLANATVYLSGTPYRTVTDADGLFLINEVPAGRYMMTFNHVVLDSLPVLPTPRTIEVVANDTVDIRLAIAMVETQLREKCGATAGGTLFGRVIDRDGRLQPNAEVTVTYDRYLRAGGQSRTEREKTEYKQSTDKTGQYLICSMPAMEQLTVTVEAGDLNARIETNVSEKQFKRLDIVVR